MPGERHPAGPDLQPNTTSGPLQMDWNQLMMPGLPPGLRQMMLQVQS